MIVKHIPIRKMNKSSFSGLVQYITQAQDKNERIGDVCITNCISEQPEWAAIEAEMVQRQNTRSLVDKTYHLLVSFPAGEQPSTEVLGMIEDRLCASLGYQEHQRVALALTNTGRALSPEEAALCYIAERNDKRHQGINILPHRHYAESDDGEHHFAGLRQIKGQQLMLLQTPTEMLVLPIDGDMVHRCERLSIGNMIDVNDRGIVRSRGRTM